MRHLLVFPLQVPLVLDESEVLLNRLLSDPQGRSLESRHPTPSPPNHPQPSLPSSSPLLVPTAQVEAQVEAVGGERVQPADSDEFGDDHEDNNIDDGDEHVHDDHDEDHNVDDGEEDDNDEDDNDDDHDDLCLPPPGTGDPLLLGRPGLPGLINHHHHHHRIIIISIIIKTS